MTAKLMLKNFKGFITGTPLAFLVIVLIEILGTIAIIISYGIVRNVFTEQEKESYFSKVMIYERWREDEGYTYWEDSGSIIEAFKKIVLKYGDIFASAILDGVIQLNDKEYTIASSEYLSASSFDLEGVSFDEFVEGKNVVVVREDYLCKIGDYINIEGKDYKIIGIMSEMIQSVNFIFPFNNSPKNIKYDSLYLHFKEIPTKKICNEIKNSIEESFGSDYPIQEPDIPDLLVKQFNAVMLVGCTIAMILIISNCITVYMYILRRRKNWLTVVKLCGCKNRNLIEIFLSEMLLVSCICFGIGYMISDQLIIPKMSRFYPAFETVYVSKAYICLFVGFVIISIFISYIRLLLFVNKPIDSMRKGAA